MGQTGALLAAAEVLVAWMRIYSQVVRRCVWLVRIEYMYNVNRVVLRRVHTTYHGRLRRRRRAQAGDTTGRIYDINGPAQGEAAGRRRGTGASLELEHTTLAWSERELRPIGSGAPFDNQGCPSEWLRWGYEARWKIKPNADARHGARAVIDKLGRQHG